jgi:uncharacterized membrane protein YfcA
LRRVARSSKSGVGARASNLPTLIALGVVTFSLGIILGFVGAGGAGLVVALLTGLFRLPVHQAIGTALAAMCFVTITGTISHIREGNVAVGIGVIVGLSGMIGAVAGANTGQSVSEPTLKLAAGLALWALAALVWLRTRLMERGHLSMTPSSLIDRPPARSPRDWTSSIGLGLTGGAAAAFLGVGMAPFLQLGFLTMLRLPLRQTVGTTMLTLVFISAAGTVVLARHGDVSLPYLVGCTAGLSTGSYIGARFTRRAPGKVLRGAVVTVPIVAGSMLLFL